MNLKELFGSANNSVTNTDTLNSLDGKIESEGFANELIKEKDRFFPFVDYSDPQNFAKYGSAYKYYTDTITYIYTTYPYDGSLKEKQEWRNNSSDLDLYFADNLYPKFKGFVSLGSSSFNLHTVSSFITGGIEYSSSAYPQFIYLDGRVRTDPNATSLKNLEKSNVYDALKNRQSNLEIDNVNGNTIEFFFKLNDTNTTKIVSLLDIWNNSNNPYNRLLLELSNSNFYVTYNFSGSAGDTGVYRQQLSVTNNGWDINEWNHYAFVIKSETNGINAKLFVNGELSDTFITGTQLNASLLGTTALTGTIGAYQTSPEGKNLLNIGLGSGSVYGSFDSFRFWKTTRTQEQIYRAIRFEVGGGANTDDFSSDLGVYLKFNEGVFSTSNNNLNTNDSICLDYSGRINNGFIYNYTFDVRQSGSAIESFDSDVVEKGDLIINSTHPDVISVLTNYQNSGSVYDYENVNSLINMFPAWILDEEEQLGKSEFANLIQIISSYFDHLLLQIDNVTTFKELSYAKNGEKIHPEFSKILNSTGFRLNDLFADISIDEELLSRSDDVQFAEKLENIKNIIYKNIYNNLSFIFKSKGTEKSFRNLIRCFGIDDDVVSINTYSNNFLYSLDDKPNENSVQKKVISFNSEDNFAATIFITKSLSDSEHRSYLTGTDDVLIPYTAEIDVTFPKKFNENSTYYFNTTFQTCSVFGSHAAKNDENDYTWETNDYGNFQVYLVRPDVSKPHGYFALESTGFGSSIVLTSSIYQNVYNDTKWNFAVRLKNSKYDLVNLATASSNENYILEFYAANSYIDTVENEFLLTASVPYADAVNAIKANKRLYTGAHRLNFTSSLYAESDVKLNSVRFWYSYLANDIIKQHSFDPLSYGVEDPINNSSFGNVSGTYNQLPNAKTLALYWNFDNITTPDNNGTFTIQDFSSGSAVSLYGNSLGIAINKKHEGSGRFFSPNDANAIITDYIFASKKSIPENIYTNDFIKIKNENSLERNIDIRTTLFYFSFEKSMYRVISNEMMRMLSSTKELNNLIGLPINKFRFQYQDLNYLRQLFFDKVGNQPDINKFIEFYKWIDSSIFFALKQLIPATANFSNNLSNVVESHVLERNKININRSISLTLNRKIDNVVSVSPSSFSGYSYSDIKPPNSPAGSKWLKERQPRNLAPVNTPGFPLVDASRELIRQGAYKTNNEKVSTFYDFNKQALIDSFKEKFNYSKPVAAFLISKPKFYEYEKTNNIDNFKSVADLARQFNIFVSSEIKSYGNINSALNKQKVFLTASTDLNNPDFSQLSPDMLPFEHYLDLETSASYKTNIHADFTNQRRDTSLQGTFTEKHVGGNAHRHNSISEVAENRSELYKINSDNSLTIDTIKPRISTYRNIRNKSPINVRNILTTDTDVGNYLNKYEVIQTVGRSTNNKDYVEKEGTLNDFTNIKIIGAITSSATSSRGIYKSIFVNRFSSPGDLKTSAKAFLDPISEEYSVYNTINYRNFDQRIPLNISSSQTYSIDENNPSIHKVNKNPFYGFALSGTSDTVAVTSINYDNGFVSNTIPRAEKQYYWITASLSNNVTASGYFSEYSNTNVRDYYEFLTDVSRSVGNVNFSGYGLFLEKTISTDSLEISPNTQLDGDKLNSYLLNLNGPYGYCSWKQIKNSYNPIVQKLKNTNTFTDQKLLSSEDFNNLLEDRSNNSSLHHPLNYQKVKKLYSSSFYSWYSPIFEYTKPDKLIISRNGQNFLFNLNYFLSLLDFPSNLGQQDLPSKFGITAPDGTSPFRVIETVSEYKNYQFKKPQIFKLFNIINISNNLNFEKPYKFVYYNISKDVIPSSISSNIRGRSFYDDFEIAFRPATAASKFEGPKEFFYSAELTYPDLRSYWNTSTTVRARHFNINSSATINASSSFKVINDLFDDGTSYYELKNIKIRKAEDLEITFINNTTPGSTDSVYSNSIWALDYVTSSVFTGSVVSIANNSCSFAITSSFGVDSVPFTKGDLSPYNDFESFYFHTTNITASNYKLMPHPQLFFSNKSPIHSGSGLLYHGVNTEYAAPLNPSYKSEFIKPFYDSYNEFFEEIRPAAKQYASLPEFAISDMVPFVLNNKNGAFGGESTKEFIDSRQQSTQGKNKTYLRNFYKYDLYGNDNSFEGFLFDKFFNISENRNDLKFKIDLSCLVKLLPYKGFYPSDKVVELSQKFINSLNQDLIQAQNVDDTPRQQKILTLLQPFFAPGILLNTVKASLAMDWPVYITNSLGYTGSNNNSAPFNTSGSVNYPIMYATGTNTNISGFDPDQYYYFLDKNFNYRIPFEAILDFNIPSNFLYDSASLYYTDPSNFIATGTTAFPSFKALDIKFVSKEYNLAMHNFLAELPNFFLSKNDGRLNGLATFESNALESVSVSPNTNYAISFYVERDNDFINVISSSLLPEQSLFGPPVRYWDTIDINAALNKSELTQKLYSKFAFMPFAPAYTYGKEVATINFFSGVRSGSIPVQEVLENCTISFENANLKKQLGDETYSFTLNNQPFSTPAYSLRNTLSSSINFFSLIDSPEFEQDASGQVNRALTTKKKWIVQTKFETPSINFSGSTIQSSQLVKNTNSDPSSGVWTNNFATTWTKTVEQPTSIGGSSIKFGIEELPTNLGYKSLADLFGFPKKVMNIGQLAEEQTISEAVLIIPWSATANYNGNYKNGVDYAETLSQEITSEQLVQQTNSGDTRKAYYYKIDRSVIQKELDKYTGNPGSYTIGRNFDFEKFNKISTPTTSSIINTIKMMCKYNVPPSLDWVRYDDIPPFVMYIIEITHNLTRQDLSDIWQGNMSSISEQVTNIKNSSFEHSFGVDEFYHGKKLDTLSTNFIAFKVKKKAKINYFKITATPDDDDKFKIVTDSNDTIVPDYSFNWPYDYFSLIEGAKVSISLEAGNQLDSSQLVELDEDLT